MKKTAIILLAIFIMGIGLYFGLKNVILQKMYPKKYSEYVELYAKQYEVNSLLVYAIIQAESNFRADSNSKSGAIGLMQVMLSTAKETAEEIEDIQSVSVEDLYNPQSNIQLGVKYFSLLLKKYQNNIPLALAAYNAGMGNVDRWIEEGILKADGTNIENIPYRETNQYVRKIVNSFQIYQQLYTT